MSRTVLERFAEGEFVYCGFDKSFSDLLSKSLEFSCQILLYPARGGYYESVGI